MFNIFFSSTGTATLLQFTRPSRITTYAFLYIKISRSNTSIRHQPISAISEAADIATQAGSMAFTPCPLPSTSKAAWIRSVLYSDLRPFGPLPMKAIRIYCNPPAPFRMSLGTVTCRSRSLSPKTFSKDQSCWKDIY